MTDEEMIEELRKVARAIGDSHPAIAAILSTMAVSVSLGEEGVLVLIVKAYAETLVGRFRIP